MTLRPVFRILTLRARVADYEQLGSAHLLLGLGATWLVGIGRYWDNPRVSWLQHAGIGSLVYVVLLTCLLWLIGIGLRPARWSLRHLFTFVTLTALPGLLYAIPVERWLSPETARTTNLWFLAVVATWRVLMYARYLRVYAGLPLGALLVQLFLPLTLIVSALAALNLERAVFDIMGGVRETTAADAAYEVVVTLTMLSVVLFPILFLFYVVLAILRRRQSADHVRPVEPTGGGGAE